jgi:plastocyanin
VRAVTTAFLLMIVASACSSGSTAAPSSSSAAAGPASRTVTVHAEDTLRFDHDTYRAMAGTVTIIYVDDGTLRHTLSIDGHPELMLVVDADHPTDRGTIDLQRGSYALACDVPGHRAAGMVATLFVE